MLTPEQIREARRLFNETNQTPWEFIAKSRDILPAALDTIEAQRVEIERLQSVIDQFWEIAAVRRVGICNGVNCLGRQSCGSPECKKAFMEHYLGGEDIG